MRGRSTGGRATPWRELSLLALAVAVLGCCCPALPPPTLAWQVEFAAVAHQAAGHRAQPPAR
jgi:hypothetical protein